MLKIPLDFGLDASYKRGGFFETLPQKSLQFVPSRGDGIVVFNLSFLLLPAEVNPVLKEQNCKKDAFVVYGSGRVEMIFTLLIEVIILHI